MSIACRTLLFLMLALSCRPAAAGGQDLLFVVANSSSLTTGEGLRKSGFEMYGYTVTVIDDNASQASFNAAVAANNVAFVSPDVVDTALGTKLKSVTIGVVVEAMHVVDEFGFATNSVAMTTQNYLDIQLNTHYITYGLSTGNVVILSSGQVLARRTGTLAAGAVNLAHVERNPGQTDPGLLALEVGAALYGGGTATGRRVLLPVGSNTFTPAALNNVGITLWLRAIEWAARPNPSLGSVLLPVANTASLTSQERLKQMQIDVWGYDVVLIDDDASAGSYTTAFNGKVAVYVSKDVNAASLGTKLTNCPIGVVNEVYGLSDEIGLSSTSAGVAATSVTISENTHYITSPFTVGALTILDTSQTAGTLTGTTAPGLQTLATIAGVRALCVLESGGVLSTATTAAGRRVQLPWGGSAFDFTALNVSGKRMMRRSIEWAASSVGTKILMAVANSGSLGSQELARKTLLESWGYAVNIIDDDETLANYNLATAANTVAYVPASISSSSLGTKLTTTALGVVNESGGAAVGLGLATGTTSGSQHSLTITEANHYITSPLGLVTTAMFSSSQNSNSITGAAGGLQIIGQWGSAPALGTLEAGRRLVDKSQAAGRRVQLPWGGTGFSISTLNANGQTILRRSLQWAAGLIGHWRFDEPVGSIADDASPYSDDGTLTGGMTFAGQSVTGNVNRGLDFNGSSHYITVANRIHLQVTQALTISAWIKGDTWSSGGTVNSILRKGDNNPNNYQLSVANGRLEGSLDGNDGASFQGATSLQAGKWYHVAMTWDGALVRLYVNGVLDNTPAAKAAPIGSDSRALYLGGRTGNTDFFNGTLDDIRLYNYALGASEIATLKGMSTGVRIVKWVEVK